MTFLRSIVLLASVCLCIAFVYFFGHALAVHSTTPIIIGAALLLAGAAGIAALSRGRVRHW
jgi:uncharacterized membrane protein HdeD (DUF308 family)